MLEKLAKDAAWPLEDIMSLITKVAEEILRQEIRESMH